MELISQEAWEKACEAIDAFNDEEDLDAVMASVGIGEDEIRSVLQDITASYTHFLVTEKEAGEKPPPAAVALGTIWINGAAIGIKALLIHQERISKGEA